MTGRAAVLVLILLGAACGRSDQPLTEWQRARSDGLEVVLLSPQGAPRHGHDTLVIEFRSATDGKLVDVGDVRATATMLMTGMPMAGSMDVTRTNVVGRYTVATELEMAGTWRVEVRWQSASETKSAVFAGAVR